MSNWYRVTVASGVYKLLIDQSEVVVDKNDLILLPTGTTHTIQVLIGADPNVGGAGR